MTVVKKLHCLFVGHDKTHWRAWFGGGWACFRCGAESKPSFEEQRASGPRAPVVHISLGTVELECPLPMTARWALPMTARWAVIDRDIEPEHNEDGRTSPNLIETGLVRAGEAKALPHPISGRNLIFRLRGAGFVFEDIPLPTSLVSIELVHD